MKKTLVALAVAAFASSASALTVYEKDGSKVDFEGSIRLRLEQNGTKYKYNQYVTDKTKEKRAHSNLHNDGTRFQIKAQHDLSEDLYAVGRLEFRFDSGAAYTDKFGDLRANRAYVGLGSKTFGEVTFGRQETIGDDIAQAGFDKAYGVFDTTLTTAGKSVIRYDYKGIEGLQIGADYRFAEEREDGEVKAPYQKDPKKADSEWVYPIKNGYGVGAVYEFGVAEGQSLTLASGYTRDNYKVDGKSKHHRDAWAAGAAYKLNDLTLAADYAGAFEKKANSSKERFNGFRLGAKYQVTPAVAVYTNYGHRVEKEKDDKGMTAKKTVGDKFMLGSSYQVHKSVSTYVEGGFVKEKITEGKAVTRKTDKNIGVGLRVFW